MRLGWLAGRLLVWLAGLQIRRHKGESEERREENREHVDSREREREQGESLGLERRKQRLENRE